MALRAVLFDLDGTLVDSAPAIAAALSRIRTALGGRVIGEAVARPWVSLGAPELMHRALGDLACDPESHLAAFRAMLASVPTPPGSLYPGVPRLLSRLRAVGLSLAVVTNKPETLARKLLHELALEAEFGAVVGGDSTANAKPHPAPLVCALDLLGVSASDAAFVGDGGIDARAATALDMPFHLFEGGYGAGECDHAQVASRFSDHADVFEALLPAARAA